MTTLPIIFPGQGAQARGMGRDFAEAFPEAAATWEEADQALGFSLRDACWEAEDEVNRTDIAQPGIFTAGVAAIRVLQGRGLDLSAAPFTAGLSLGEYTAHWAAGTFNFADGLRLVRLRGEAMQDAAETNPSGMASLMGATPEQAEALAAVGAEHGICQVANLNAPGQIVISGAFPALDAVEACAKEHGVRRVRRLVVAGGFHSECMRPAADRLAEALAKTDISAPAVPVISNVTAAPVRSPEEVRSTLATQVCAPVLWERSMRRALDEGHRRFLEAAPGTILAGILRKIDAEAEVIPLSRPEEVEGALASVGSA
ncbi:MAG: ACP S-malonyltransferase [Planctomycetota bacterium]|nr:ACP S-malonyltransferase [Planctomycetota bacterium]MDG1983860.1 ACP S-malonyltransferase [Planctomycetota bacterium]